MSSPLPAATYVPGRPRGPQPTRPLLVTVVVCAVVAGLVRIVMLVLDWRQVATVGDAGTRLSDLRGAQLTQLFLTLGMVVPLLAATAVMLTWVWRVRVNAELLSPAPHRTGRAWAVWCWIVPIANVIFPRQVLEDVWAASKPSPPARAEPAANDDGLIRTWWWVSLVGLGVYLVAAVAVPRPTVTYDFRGNLIVEGTAQARSAFLANAIANTLLLGLATLTAVLLFTVMARITRMQTDRVGERPTGGGSQPSGAAALEWPGTPATAWPPTPAPDPRSDAAPPAASGRPSSPRHPSAPAYPGALGYASPPGQPMGQHPGTPTPHPATPRQPYPAAWVPHHPGAPGQPDPPPSGQPYPGQPYPPAPGQPYPGAAPQPYPGTPGQAPVHGQAPVPGQAFGRPPAHPAYPPIHRPPPRAAKTEGVVAALFVWLAVLIGPLPLVVVGLRLADPAGDLDASLRALIFTMFGLVLGPSAAGPAVIFWLWRARANIEVISGGPRGLSQGWTIGSWLVPLANLALPLVVVLDVLRGTRRPGFGLAVTWWVCWLGGWAAIWAAFLATSVKDFGMPGFRDYGPFITFSVLGLVLMASAAALLNAIMVAVNAGQEDALNGAGY